jgi:hypothetical protein
MWHDGVAGRHHVVSLLCHILSTIQTQTVKQQFTGTITHCSDSFFQRITTTTRTMANNTQWADSEARELLEKDLKKDLKSGRVPLEKSKAWPRLRVCNLPERPQFWLFECKKFIANLRHLRNHIKVKRQAGAVCALALAHDRSIHGGIHRAAAANCQQGGAPCWDGSLAQQSLNQDMDECKHMTMKPKELRATRDEHLVFDEGVFAKHIPQEVTTRKFLVHMKAKVEKMKKRRG